MNEMLKIYLILLVLLFIFDLIWLTTTNKRFYQKELKGLMLEKIKYLPAVLFYLIYPIGITLFVIAPNTIGHNLLNTGIMGAIFGFICYGTYDFTNLATLKNWSLKVTIVDLIWGSLLTAVSSVLCLALL